MLDSVKITRRQSEIRQELATLVGKENPSEDETRSMEALDAEYRTNETRFRAALVAEGHECLNLRFPGAREFQWPLVTEDGPKKFRVTGRYESDDGDVLTDWALAGHGIVMKPVFEVADHMRDGRLVPVAEATPPEPVQMACLYTHRKRQDPKTRLFMEFVIERIANVVAG